MKVTEELRQEQRDYYRLCDEAKRLGIPTSLDDPRTIRTIPEFMQQVVNAAHNEALGFERGIRARANYEASLR